MDKTIVHVAECSLNPNGGMGRVAWHWKTAFEARGYRFLHIGLDEVGPLKHPSHFPRAARRFYHELGQRADVLLVHEPASGAFVDAKDRMIVVSHGLERRYWNLQRSAESPDLAPVRLKTRLLYPWWRLAGGDRGLRAARALLLINEEDREFAIRHYARKDASVFVFKNGADPVVNHRVAPELTAAATILFMGSWLDRKGVKTLARAAALLRGKSVTARWLLAGTGKSAKFVLREWPDVLRDCTEVVATFDPANEADFYERADLFVLPSFFEGQPLTLLQAMATGCCCVTTDNSGQKDLIRHRQNGLLFQAGDAVALASLIETAMTDRLLRAELGVTAKDSVAARTWPGVSNEVVDFVEKVVDIK